MPAVVAAAYQTKVVSTNAEVSKQPELKYRLLQVCQEIFLDKRWNCSTIDNAPSLLPDLSGGWYFCCVLTFSYVVISHFMLTAGSREQAFVYALSSAALVQNIAKTCSQGLTTQCGCAPHPTEAPPEAQFSWGGCGDNVGYGSLVAELFADANAKQKRNAKISLVNQHNNAAGRAVSTCDAIVVR